MKRGSVPAVLLILPDIRVTESQSRQVRQRHRTAASDEDKEGDQLQRGRQEVTLLCNSLLIHLHELYTV